jgi:uncharacterized protein (DUF305 family)
MRPSILILATIAIAVFAALALSTEAVPQETLSQPGDDFTTDNARAMDRMMVAMNVPPSGNVDRDFVATMVPHHQGAIDMALAELRYGHDETLRRMAQEIIVEQRQEIDAMRLAASHLPDATPGGSAVSDVCRSRPTPQLMHASMMQGEH